MIISLTDRHTVDDDKLAPLDRNANQIKQGESWQYDKAKTGGTTNEKDSWASPPQTPPNN